MKNKKLIVISILIISIIILSVVFIIPTIRINKTMTVINNYESEGEYLDAIKEVNKLLDIYDHNRNLYQKKYELIKIVNTSDEEIVSFLNFAINKTKDDFFKEELIKYKFESINNLLDRQKYEKAEEQIKEILLLDERYLEAYSLLYKIHTIQQKPIKDIIPLLKKAINDNNTIENNIIKDFQDIIYIFDSLESVDKLILNREYSQAEKILNEIIKIDNKNIEAYKKLYIIYLHKKDGTEIIRLLDNAFSHTEDNFFQELKFEIIPKLSYTYLDEGTHK